MVEFLLGDIGGAIHKNLNFLRTLIKFFFLVTKLSGNQLCINRLKEVVKNYYESKKLYGLIQLCKNE